MLRAQPTVPKHLGVVEAENGARFFRFDEEIMVPRNDFKVEDAEFVVGVEGVGFVDDGADGGVFVEDDLADEGFVGEVGLAEVYLGWRVDGGLC